MHLLFLSTFLTLSSTGRYPRLPPGTSLDDFIPRSDEVPDPQYCHTTQALWDTSNAVYDFSQKIVKKVDALQTKSYVVAPLSIALHMFMLNNGTVGESNKSIRRLLRHPTDHCVPINGVQAFIDDVAIFKEVGLEVDHRVFVSSRMQLRPQFISGMTKNFRAAVQRVNFYDSEEASRIINAWCEEKTNNHVDTVTKTLNVDTSTSLAIASVVHFKRKWAQPFDATKTKSYTFIDSFGVRHRVPVMNARGLLRYGLIEGVDASVIELPYESKPNAEGMSMFIIAPTDPTDKTISLSLLENLNILRIRDMAVSTNGRITLPKFKIESEIDVKLVIDAITGGQILHPTKLNLSGIAESLSLYVDEYVQRTVISVDEEGTEVTTTDALYDSPTTHPETYSDRPFYVLICTIHQRPQIIFAARVSP